MDEKPLLSYIVWLSLPREVRAKLAKVFNIPRTGESIIRSNSVSPEGNIMSTVQSDGYTPADLYAISLEKMQEMNKSSSTNFYELFDETLKLITHGEYVPGQEKVEALAVEPKNKGGRPKGSATGGSMKKLTPAQLRQKDKYAKPQEIEATPEE